MSCPTSSTCFAVGGTSAATVEASTDGGSTWGPIAVPGGTPGLNAIDCTSASSCVAVGGTDLLSTVNGAVSWTVSQTTSAISINGVSCSSASCVAVGQLAGGEDGFSVMSTDGGTSWSAPTTVPGTILRSVACPVASTCWATGGNSFGAVVGTTNGGATWSTQFTNKGSNNQSRGITCPTTSECVEVGNADLRTVEYTSDAGADWEAMNDLGTSAGARTWDAVSCWSATGCEAVGVDAPISMLSLTAGHWHAQNLPSSVGQLNGLSCLSAADCVAVGAAASGGGGSIVVLR